MAYDLDPTKDPSKDEEKPESQYSALLAPATNAGTLQGPTASAAAASPAVAPKVSTPGFVSFDRYLNANRGTLEAQRNAQQARVNAATTGLKSKFDALTGQIGQEAKAGGVAAPTGSHVVPDSTLMAPGFYTQDEVTQNAAAKYAGPDKSQVDSRYAPLLQERQRLESEARAAKVAPSSFDEQLMRGVGGVDYSGVEKLGGAYDRSVDTAKKSIDDATTASEASAGKWNELLGRYNKSVGEQADAARVQAAKDRSATYLNQTVTGHILRHFGPEKAAAVAPYLKDFSPQELQALDVMARLPSGYGKTGDISFGDMLNQLLLAKQKVKVIR